MTLAVAFKEVFSQLDLTTLSVVAMVTFILSFLSMLGWAIARSREEIRHWSTLPLADDGVAGSVQDRLE